MNHHEMISLCDGHPAIKPKGKILFLACQQNLAFYFGTSLSHMITRKKEHVPIFLRARKEMINPCQGIINSKLQILQNATTVKDILGISQQKLIRIQRADDIRGKLTERTNHKLRRIFPLPVRHILRLRKDERQTFIAQCTQDFLCTIRTPVIEHDHSVCNRTMPAHEALNDVLFIAHHGHNDNSIQSHLTSIFMYERHKHLQYGRLCKQIPLHLSVKSSYRAAACTCSSFSIASSACT